MGDRSDTNLPHFFFQHEVYLKHSPGRRSIQCNAEWGSALEIEKEVPAWTTLVIFVDDFFAWFGKSAIRHIGREGGP